MQLGEAFITVSLTLSPTASRTVEGTAKTAGTNAGQAFAKAFSEASNKLTVKNPDVEATYRKAGTSAGKAMASALSTEANKFTVKGPDAKLAETFGAAGKKAGTALGKNLSESAVKATDLRKITPDARIESTFGVAGGKAGTKFGTELSTNAKKTVHLDNITPPAEIERRFQEAGKKAGTSFGASIGPAGKGAVDLKGIVPPATIANSFHDAGVKAGKELGSSIGVAARGAVDLKGIAPPSTLANTFHDSGVKAGKELGSAIGPSARGAVDLKGIAPPDTIGRTFHEAGVKAGKELGGSIGAAARGAVDLKGIAPPGTLAATFKEAGTRAGKELGASIGPNARGAVDLKGIVPPSSLKATFGAAGGEAGRAFGTDLSRMAKQATDLRNLTPPTRIKTAFGEAGSAAGSSFGTNLQERTRAGVEGMVARVKAGAAQAEAAMRGVGARAGSAFGNSLSEGTKTRLNGLKSQVTGAFNGLPATMGGIGGSSAGEFAKRFDEKLHGIKDSIKRNLVDGAKLLGPLAFVGAIAGIAKIGAEYETNMNIFKSVTRATDAQMKSAADTAIKLGNDVKLPGVSAADAAEAMTSLAKSGLSVEDSMVAAKSALQLARAGEIDAGKAADIAASAMQTFRLKASDLPGVMDAFANVANSSSLEIKDVADSFKMASAVFSGFLGPSVGAKNAMNDLNVAIGILGQNGIKGSDAGTSLKQMMLQLTGPSASADRAIKGLSMVAFGAKGQFDQYSQSIMKNGKVIGKTATTMDLFTAITKGSATQSKDALAQFIAMNPEIAKMGTFAYTATGTMRPLRDQIKILGESLKGMSEESKASTLTLLFGADATRSIIALLHSGVSGFDAMSAAIGRQGSAAEIAQARNAGMAGALDAVKSTVETAAIAIYKALTKPITGGLFTAAQVLPKVFNVVGQEAGKLLKPLGEVVKFVGNVIKAFAPLAGTLGVAVWLALRTAIQAVGLVLTPLNALMSAHTTTSKILGTAIGIIVIAYNAEKIALIATTVLTRTWGVVTGTAAVIARGAAIATNLWTAAQWLLNAAFKANPIGVVIVVITALVAVIVLAYNKNKWFHDLVVTVWAGVKTAIAAVADWFVKTAWPAIKVALDAMGKAFEWLWKNAIVPAWDGIKTAATVAWPVIKAIFDVGVTVIKAYGAVYTWLWNNAVKPAWDGIKVVISTGWAAIQVVLNAASASLKVWGAIFTWLNVNIIKPAWEGIKTVISVAWADVQVILNAGAAFLRTWAAVFTWLRDTIIKPVWDGIKIAIQVAWVAIQIVYKSWEIAGKLLAIAVQWFWTAVIKPTWTAISQFLASTWNTIKTTVFMAWETYIRGPFMSMWNWFKTTFTTLWTTLKTFLFTTWTSIKTTIFDAWATYIKGPFTQMWNTFKTWFTTLWTSIKSFLLLWWTAIKISFFDTWANYVKGPFTAMWNTFKAFFTTLWNAIKSMLVTVWNAIKSTVFDVWSNYMKGPFTAMWNAFKAFITACWSAIKAAISAAWNWLKSSVFNPMMAFIKGPVVAAFNTMKSAVLNVWNGLKTGLSATWNWIKSNIFTPLVNFITKNVPDAFSRAVGFIKTAWSKLTAIVGDPVKTFVSKVINGWIIGGFNKIASKVGVGTISPVTFAMGGIVPAQNAASGGKGQSRGFAVGGVMPGYTPGRDVHKFYSPTGGRLDLSGGEAVMRPEFTRAVGPATVHKLNSAARSGGVSGVKSALGLATGGIIGSPGAHASFANGGIIDTASSWWEAITNMTKSVANVISDATGGIAGVTHASPYLNSLFTGLAKTLISGAHNFVRGSHTGGGSAGQTNIIGSTKGAGKGYQWQIAALQKLGLGARITSTTGGGHAPGSYHYQGRAIDIGNESMAMFNAIKKNFGAQSMELIYGPAGGGNIWHGKPHNYSAGTLAEHYNHIHWAMANGGVYGSKNANTNIAKYDSGGWLEPGMTGVNRGRRPEAVLTPAESDGLKGMGAGQLIDKLDELIDAVERIAPGVGAVMRGTGSSLRAAGRSV